MRNTRRNLLSRRALLQVGAATAATAPMAHAMRAFHGRGAGDYKALVCVFLYGGADTFNLLVPTSQPEYDVYAASRGDLAEPLGSLLPITPLTPDGATYGVHSAMPEVHSLFQSGRLAFVPNVGPLVRPTTKADFLSGTAELPPHLFSHSDQQVQWQAAHADGPRTTGWAGRMLDRITGASPAPLSPGISVEITGRLLVGDTVQPYVLGIDGTEPLALVEEPGRRAVVDAIMQSRHALGAEFARVQREAIEIDDAISGELDAAPTFDGVFPQNGLARQLRTVARMISVRQNLGVTRQVFFVGIGGFDTHDAQTQQLPGLFAVVSSALAAFQTAMDQIGEADRVTAFTHTEFGRTLTSNGQGSDHGWGGHAIALGGAVRGQDIWGTMPDLALDGPDDVGQGRIVPTASVDQFGATLAKWFGLPPAEIDLVFPNVGRFGSRDLGFLV